MPILNKFPTYSYCSLHCPYISIQCAQLNMLTGEVCSLLDSLHDIWLAVFDKTRLDCRFGLHMVDPDNMRRSMFLTCFDANSKLSIDDNCNQNCSCSAGDTADSTSATPKQAIPTDDCLQLVKYASVVAKSIYFCPVSKI